MRFYNNCIITISWYSIIVLLYITLYKLTFSNTWDDGDTCVVNFNKAYATAPQVIVSNLSNGSGASLIEFDLITRAADKFTITASGTCAGKVTYFVIETV